MLQPANIAIGLGWTLTALVSLALALPLIARRVGPNHLYGARLREAFTSDEAWFAINEFAGRRCALWSLATLAGGVAAFFVPLPDNAWLAIPLALVPICFVLIPMFETWRFAKRFGGATPTDRLS